MAHYDCYECGQFYCTCPASSLRYEQDKLEFEKKCKLLKDNHIPFYTRQKSNGMNIFDHQIVIDQYTLFSDLESGKLKLVSNPKVVEDDQDLIFNLTKDYNNK